MLKYILLAAAVLIALITAWYFLWYKPTQAKAPLTGPCKTNLGLPGSFVNGVCVHTPPSEDNLPL